MLLDISTSARIAPKNLTGMSLDRQIFDYHWAKNGGLVVIAADGFRTRFHGIDPQGVVQDAERLVVEGTVEATMIHATELSIAPGGVFKGEVELEDAEIAGTIDGTLTIRGSLIVRSTGKVLGTARCRRLQVEDGGQITGRMEMIADQPQSDLPVRQNAEPVI